MKLQALALRIRAARSPKQEPRAAEAPKLDHWRIGHGRDEKNFYFVVGTKIFIESDYDVRTHRYRFIYTAKKYVADNLAERMVIHEMEINADRMSQEQAHHAAQPIYMGLA